jgi:DNA-directed RNA polymerase specialized sigma24 family protein
MNIDHDDTDDYEITTARSHRANLLRDDDLAEVLALATQGDRPAINLIARDFWETLVQEARAVLKGCEHDAEDVVQDFFLAMLEGELLFVSGMTPARAWISRKVRAMARDHRRYGT